MGDDDDDGDDDNNTNYNFWNIVIIVILLYILLKTKCTSRPLTLWHADICPQRVETLLT